MRRLLPVLLLVLATGCGRCSSHDFVNEYNDWWDSMTEEERAAVTVPYSPTARDIGAPIHLFHKGMDPIFDSVVSWWNGLTNAQREAWIREHIAQLWEVKSLNSTDRDHYELAASGLRESNGTVRPLRVIVHKKE